MSSRAWNTTLYVLGLLAETIAMTSVPGVYVDGEATDLSVLYVLGAAGLWATVFFRARMPLAPIVAGGVLAAFGSSVLLLLIGLHHAMLAADPRRRLHWGALAGGAAVLFVLRAALTPWGDGLDEIFQSSTNGPTTPVFVVGSVGALFGATALAISRRSGAVHRRVAEQARGRVQQLGDELARRDERERLAREIHDTIAHRLSLLSLQGGALELAAASGDERVVEIARTMRTQAQLGLDDLRGLLGELRSSGERDPDPSRASMRAIGELVRGARAAGATVDATIMVDGVEQAAAVLDRTVYRVVQESMTNAVKHAAGAPISVFAEASPSAGVRVRVTNPIRAAAEIADEGSGAGTIGIRERAVLLGGEAWIGVHEGEFIVDVSFPWIRSDAAAPAV